MLDIKFIRENPEKVNEGIKNKGIEVDIDRLLKLDEGRRKFLQEVEKLRAEQNKATEEIAKSKDGKAVAKGGKPRPDDSGRERKLEEMKKLKKDLKEKEKKLDQLSQELESLLLTVPNLPLNDVPIGKDESGNKVLREEGEKPKFDFEPKDYLEIAEKLDLIDVERAAKVSGSRFGYIKKELALLEFALVQFTFELLTSQSIIREIAISIGKNYSVEPFVPVVPPVIVKPDVFARMARLSESDKDERYYLAKDDLYLVGSAEHTLGPMHMNETFQEHDLPIRYVGFSTCFRREAGSYGKDTKGILRVHQFDKLEMESFTINEYSVLEQDFIVAIQEYLVKSLCIPYRVVLMCTGDMGMPDARQIDIESWMPGQNQYRETHTSDLMTDYQARRLNTRVRRENGELEFVHMNDATAFAIGRTLIAIIENYQQKDGSIKVPEVLQKYVGFSMIPNS